eukprot:g25870.t1
MRTFTTCGTPDYFAPEMIASTGHNHAVDWWTLGILAYELMAGHPPFESAHPMQIYQKVNKGINKVNFPKKPSERLAMRKGGATNIRKHSWFNLFEWEKYDNGNMPSPYKPQVSNKKDMANFAARKEDMPPSIPYKEGKRDISEQRSDAKAASLEAKANQLQAESQQLDGDIRKTRQLKEELVQTLATREDEHQAELVTWSETVGGRWSLAASRFC